MDTTKLGDNFADLNEYVSGIAEHVQQLKEQNSANDTRATSSVEKQRMLQKLALKASKLKEKADKITNNQTEVTNNEQEINDCEAE